MNSLMSPWAIAQSPLQRHHMMLVVLSTMLALGSLLPVVEPIFMRMVFPVVFVGITWLPRTYWNTLTRFVLFALLSIAVVVSAGGLSDEVGTSLLISVMMIKYVEMKTTRDAAVMSLFNLIMPFVAFMQSQTPLILILGTSSLVLTLTLSQALHNHAEETLSATVRQNVVRLLKQFALILPLSVAVYMLMPRLDTPVWGLYKRMKGGSGLSEEMNVGRWQTMFSDLSTAFRVRFEGRPPPAREMYFRGFTLWTFDGQKWNTAPIVPSAVTETPQVRGVRTQKTYTYTVSYENREKRVYAMDYPVFLPEGVRRSSDDSLLAYALRSSVIQWTSGQGVFQDLTPAERQSALQLPEGRNPRVLEWAKKERSRFSSDRAFADFVSQHLKTQFLYTLDPSPVGVEAVDDFFFETKQGFCAHFSSAHVVILRAAGIPARVVNGYYASEISELGDYYRVRQADAHAWTEVWLDQQWVRYDPTSSVGATTMRSQEFGWEFWNRSYDTVDWMKDFWDRYVLFYDEAAQEQTMSQIKKTFSWEGLKSLAVWLKERSKGVGLGALAVLALVWFWNWNRRRHITKQDVSQALHALLAKLNQPNPSIPFKKRARLALRSASSEDKEKMSLLMQDVYDLLYNPNSKLKSSSVLKKIKSFKISPSRHERLG